MPLFQNMHRNYMNWMQNTLSQEVEDWKKEHDPELDNDDCFHTSAPIIIYQMIDENLQVIKKVILFFVDFVCKGSLEGKLSFFFSLTKK